VAAPATAAVCADVAAVEPFRFEAVTITRRVLPTSAVESVFEEPDALLLALQLPPAELHRSHWYANFKDFPCHVPGLAVRVLATIALPLIEGGVWSAGGC
jgi:hypothetical protein